MNFFLLTPFYPTNIHFPKFAISREGGFSTSDALNILAQFPTVLVLEFEIDNRCFMAIEIFAKIFQPKLQTYAAQFYKVPNQEKNESKNKFYELFEFVVLPF